ncbi:hypothetical protein C0995_002925, partial [Termitomyces sp. Mi166
LSWRQETRAPREDGSSKSTSGALGAVEVDFKQSQPQKVSNHVQGNVNASSLNPLNNTYSGKVDQLHKPREYEQGTPPSPSNNGYGDYHGSSNQSKCSDDGKGT